MKAGRLAQEGPGPTGAGPTGETPNEHTPRPSLEPRQGGVTVLVLTRKSNQSIMIGDDIEVSVLSIM